MKRRLAVIGLGAFLFAAPAAAQEAGWSGFHIGVNGTGYEQHSSMSGSADVSQLSGLFIPSRGIVIVPGTQVDFGSGAQFNISRTHTSSHKESGSLGVQAGFDWEFGGVVAGAEGDFQALRRSTTDTFTSQVPTTALTPQTTVTLQRHLRISTEWSLRARFGAVLGRSTLLYATGGIAGARVRLSNRDTFFDPGGPAAPNVINGQQTSVGQGNFGPSGPTVSTSAFSRSKIGWTAGGGIEQRFGAHFSIGLEYRHTDLRSISFSGSEAIVSQGAVVTDSNGNQPTFQPGVTGATTRVKLHSDAISLRVNFRF